MMDILNKNLVKNLAVGVEKSKSRMFQTKKQLESVKNIKKKFYLEDILTYPKLQVVYFGPMGCRIGFYLLLNGDYSSNNIVDLLIDMFKFISNYYGKIPEAIVEIILIWIYQWLNI